MIEEKGHLVTTCNLNSWSLGHSLTRRNCYYVKCTLEVGESTIFKTESSLVVLVTFCVSDNSDNTVPDHSFLFPEFEIVIETEDEITPEVLEREDELEVTGSMGKESVGELYVLSNET